MQMIPNRILVPERGLRDSSNGTFAAEIMGKYGFIRVPYTGWFSLVYREAVQEEQGEMPVTRIDPILIRLQLQLKQVTERKAPATAVASPVVIRSLMQVKKFIKQYVHHDVEHAVPSGQNQWSVQARPVLQPKINLLTQLAFPVRKQEESSSRIHRTWIEQKQIRQNDKLLQVNTRRAKEGVKTNAIVGKPGKLVRTVDVQRISIGESVLSRRVPANENLQVRHLASSLQRPVANKLSVSRQTRPDQVKTPEDQLRHSEVERTIQVLREVRNRSTVSFEGQGLPAEWIPPFSEKSDSVPIRLLEQTKETLFHEMMLQPVSKLFRQSIQGHERASHFSEARFVHYNEFLQHLHPPFTMPGAIRVLQKPATASRFVHKELRIGNERGMPGIIWTNRFSTGLEEKRLLYGDANATTSQHIVKQLVEQQLRIVADRNVHAPAFRQTVTQIIDRQLQSAVSKQIYTMPSKLIVTQIFDQLLRNEMSREISATISRQTVRKFIDQQLQSAANREADVAKFEQIVTQLVERQQRNAVSLAGLITERHSSLLPPAFSKETLKLLTERLVVTGRIREGAMVKIINGPALKVMWSIVQRPERTVFGNRIASPIARISKSNVLRQSMHGHMRMIQWSAARIEPINDFVHQLQPNHGIAALQNVLRLKQTTASASGYKDGDKYWGRFTDKVNDRINDRINGRYYDRVTERFKNSFNPYTLKFPRMIWTVRIGMEPQASGLTGKIEKAATFANIFTRVVDRNVQYVTTPIGAITKGQPSDPPAEPQAGGRIASQSDVVRLTKRLTNNEIVLRQNVFLNRIQAATTASQLYRLPSVLPNISSNKQWQNLQIIRVTQRQSGAQALSILQQFNSHEYNFPRLTWVGANAAEFSKENHVQLINKDMRHFRLQHGHQMRPEQHRGIKAQALQQTNTAYTWIELLNRQKGIRTPGHSMFSHFIIKNSKLHAALASTTHLGKTAHHRLTSYLTRHAYQIVTVHQARPVHRSLMVHFINSVQPNLAARPLNTAQPVVTAYQMKFMDRILATSGNYRLREAFSQAGTLSIFGGSLPITAGRIGGDRVLAEIRRIADSGTHIKPARARGLTEVGSGLFFKAITEKIPVKAESFPTGGRRDASYAIVGRLQIAGLNRGSNPMHPLLAPISLTTKRDLGVAPSKNRLSRVQAQFHELLLARSSSAGTMKLLRSDRDRPNEGESEQASLRQMLRQWQQPPTPMVHYERQSPARAQEEEHAHQPIAASPLPPVEQVLPRTITQLSQIPKNEMDKLIARVYKEIENKLVLERQRRGL